MADVGFPGQHTTTTTVTSNTTVQTDIRYDISYIKTIPGMLKVVQVFFSLLGFICIQLSQYRSSSWGSYYSVIAMVAFWFSGILLVFYMFHIVEKFYKIPWLKLELLFCAVWALLYIIASSLVVSTSVVSFTMAGVFGFVATFAYIVDAVMKWRAVHVGALAQGSRVISKQTTSAVREGF